MYMISFFLHTTKFHIYPLVGQVALEFEALPCLVFLLMPCSLPLVQGFFFFFSNLLQSPPVRLPKPHGLSRQFFLSALPVMLLLVPISQAGPGLATWHGTMLRLKMPAACLLVRPLPPRRNVSFVRPTMFGDASQAIPFFFSLSGQWGHNAACGTDWALVDDTTCCMIPPADPMLLRFDAVEPVRSGPAAIRVSASQPLKRMSPRFYFLFFSN